MPAAAASATAAAAAAAAVDDDDDDDVALLIRYVTRRYTALYGDSLQRGEPLTQTPKFIRSCQQVAPLEEAGLLARAWLRGDVLSSDTDETWQVLVRLRVQLLSATVDHHQHHHHIIVAIFSNYTLVLVYCSS